MPEITSQLSTALADRYRIERVPRRVLLIALFVGLDGCTADRQGSTPTEIVRLDGTSIAPSALTDRIEELTHAADVHGLTVTVFNDAEPVYSRAFGFANRVMDQPLQNGTELYGASLSRAVFAVLVMKLVEQGVIERRLGEGGMATVYLAEDLKHKRSLDRSPAWRLHRIF